MLANQSSTRPAGGPPPPPPDGGGSLSTSSERVGRRLLEAGGEPLSDRDLANLASHVRRYARARPAAAPAPGRADEL